jgi:hypothetical protein
MPENQINFQLHSSFSYLDFACLLNRKLNFEVSKFRFGDRDSNF